MYCNCLSACLSAVREMFWYRMTTQSVPSVLLRTLHKLKKIPVAFRCLTLQIFEFAIYFFSDCRYQECDGIVQFVKEKSLWYVSILNFHMLYRKPWICFILLDVFFDVSQSIEFIDLRCWPLRINASSLSPCLRTLISFHRLSCGSSRAEWATPINFSDASVLSWILRPSVRVSLPRTIWSTLLQ